MKEHYDFIIIGTGAGGGTIAKELSKSGKKILIIERGGFIPKEKENWDPDEVFSKGRYRPSEKWFDKDNQPFDPFTHYCVGGNTKMYGAALLRLRESDFQEVNHFGGVSPAWPVSYRDLEPYYTRAEYMYSVHGKRGADPTEPPSKSEYRFPPLVPEKSMEALYEQLLRLGYHPFHIPIAVRLGNENNKNESISRLSNFDGFPDLTESKADSHVVAIREALKSPQVTLLTHAYAEKLETDESGRMVSQVKVMKEGQELIFSADTIIVSCGAIQSAALMLRSANNSHPDGLANSSGLLGRNYMCHNNGALLAFSDKLNDAQFQKCFGITDFYHEADDSEYPLGTIQLMGKSDPETILGLAKDILPGKDFSYLTTHSIDFWLTSEDLPDPDNRVTLKDDGSIQLSYTPNNREAYNRIKSKLKKMFDELGAIDTDFRQVQFAGYDLGINGVSHQNGTMRFGTDPVSSVLDVNCKAHDLDNLYVVDASFFPSCGAVNPSLTIMANAIRVADHLIMKNTASTSEKMKKQTAG